MKTVVTHAGTATGTVQKILSVLDIDLVEVKTPEDVWTSGADGAILLGGADINPALYNQKHGRWTGSPQYKRDAIEFEILRYADFYNYPVLGICRGMQIMAAYFGGDLHQDIWEVVGHMHAYYHKIQITGRLGDYIPSNTVNSLHHQAVNTVPHGFKVQARAKDGIIESIWCRGLLGVQFHPELMFHTNPKWFSLFRWFAAGLI